ncbi:NAD(P)H-binding protein [Streptomyces sp. NBC_01218]|uniref:NAD(P)H-binding protein n=1 Tax=unclassified Streptomyces TaxID=2593676 RepID=UPI0023B92C59|nr:MULTISPECIES: NAD(P)H-binding protein [unclassified Streptomyces]WEH38099.1 NAD(P)H-binding protein [Streptomyces sp. AM 2-1-1]WSQ49755.1 NAD(P)H-binding protein [Streptomyces sp. NBC_01218]WSQ55086.1 NAD(P)H-binding protein [Streptomyces sp. NBC_01218]
MILVTGATGVTGALVARRLAAHRVPVRLMARDPRRVGADVPRTETVTADYADPPALRRALRGVHAAFLVTNHPTAPHDAHFLGAAAAEGVGHVVKLSAAAVADATDDLLTRRQREIEEEVRAAPLSWTLLRPRAFMSNTLAWAAGIRAKETVGALYGDAPNTPVDPRDVASVAVRALTRPEHRGKTYTLVGPQTLTARQQTAILGELLGTPVEFRERTRQEETAALARRHPPHVVTALLQRADLQAAGNKRRTGDDLERLTGHRPHSYRDWASDHLHHFSNRPDNQDGHSQDGQEAGTAGTAKTTGRA